MTFKESRAQYHELEKKFNELKGMYAQEIRRNRELWDEIAKLNMEIRSMQNLVDKCDQDVKLRLLNEKFRTMDMLTQILMTPVTECDLNNKAISLLKGCDIKYVGDLVQWTSNDLMRIRNMGKVTMGEIEKFVDIIGLRLGMEIIYDPDTKNFMVNK